MQGQTNLDLLLHSMKPRLNEGQFIFTTLPNHAAPPAGALLIFKETEGITVICERALADENGWAYPSVFAWITLDVHSSLDAVGLTAAFSGALAKNGISCNVVAGFYHDHIFVPHQQGGTAITILENLANGTDQ